MPMTMHDHATLPSLGRVRSVVWIGFVTAVLLALSVPAMTLWRTAATTLNVQAYVQPASPRVGEAVHLVIVVSDVSDRTDIFGPAAQIAAHWDMTNMAMGTREVALPGPISHTDAFKLPLHMDMAGQWWVQVEIQAPGRPAWQTRLNITVQPQNASSDRAQANAITAYYQVARGDVLALEGNSHQQMNRPVVQEQVCVKQSQNREIGL